MRPVPVVLRLTVVLEDMEFVTDRVPIDGFPKGPDNITRLQDIRSVLRFKSNGFLGNTLCTGNLPVGLQDVHITVEDTLNVTYDV